METTAPLFILRLAQIASRRSRPKLLRVLFRKGVGNLVGEARIVVRLITYGGS